MSHSWVRFGIYWLPLMLWFFMNYCLPMWKSGFFVFFSFNTVSWIMTVTSFRIAFLSSVYEYIPFRSRALSKKDRVFLSCLFHFPLCHYQVWCSARTAADCLVCFDRTDSRNCILTYLNRRCRKAPGHAEDSFYEVHFVSVNTMKSNAFGRA